MLRRVPAERAFSSSLFYDRVVRRENEKKGRGFCSPMPRLLRIATDRRNSLSSSSFVVACPRTFSRVSISSLRRFRALARSYPGTKHLRSAAEMILLVRSTWRDASLRCVAMNCPPSSPPPSKTLPVHKRCTHRRRARCSHYNDVAFVSTCCVTRDSCISPRSVPSPPSLFLSLFYLSDFSLSVPRVYAVIF